MKKTDADIISHFSKITDPRVKNKIDHKLIDMFLELPMGYLLMIHLVEYFPSFRQKNSRSILSTGSNRPPGFPVARLSLLTGRRYADHASSF